MAKVSLRADRARIRAIRKERGMTRQKLLEAVARVRIYQTAAKLRSSLNHLGQMYREQLLQNVAEVQSTFDRVLAGKPVSFDSIQLVSQALNVPMSAILNQKKSKATREASRGAANRPS